MYVTLLRHHRVDHKWRKSCTSDEYAQEETAYAQAPIIGRKFSLPLKYDYYMTSTLKRAQLTLLLIFGNIQFKPTPLLDEVPLAPFINTKHRLNVYIWLIMGRIQWFLNIKRQPETAKATYQRATQLVTRLKQMKKNCLLVGHGFFFRVLAAKLIQNGFSGKRIAFLHNAEYSTYYFE